MPSVRHEPQHGGAGSQRQAFAAGAIKAGNIARVVGAILIPLAGLWVFLRDADLPQLRLSLRAQRPAVVVVSAGLAILSLWFRALRWRLLLPPREGTSRDGLFGCVNIGFMLNNILPARIGEAARALILWKRNRYPVAVAIGSVLLERVLDTVVFMVFFFGPVLFLGVAETLRPYALVMAGAVALFVVCVGGYAAAPQSTARLTRQLAGLLPRRVSLMVDRTLDGLLSTLDWTRSFGRTLAVIVLSAVTPACYSSMLYLLALSGTPLDYGRALCATAFAALGAAIPLSPGYVGTMHAALLQGLLVLGQEREFARALTITYHAVGYVTTTLLGLWYFLHLHLRLKDISRARETLG